MNGHKRVRLMSVAGARPNFMKLASIAKAITEHNSNQSCIVPIEHIVVHTGQHYDAKMSTGFFSELGIPEPDINLGVGSASHAVQTAEIMKRFEPILLEYEPDVLLVVGDVNSTIACTLVASKVEYVNTNRKRPLIVHVEAGLRSNDRTMPEEINRILTDALSDILFVTERSGIDNLASEGVDPRKVRFVGNVMIDTLITHLEKAKKSDVKEKLALTVPYVLVTLHRPSNVDDNVVFERLINTIVSMSAWIKVVFPVHPRTLKKLESFGLLESLQKQTQIILTGPLGYLDFLNLISDSKMVVTDSGGIQEETTYLGIPCITLRENTERPVTVYEGTNYLIGINEVKFLETVENILNKKVKESKIPAFWDGNAGRRIVQEIVATFQ